MSEWVSVNKALLEEIGNIVLSLSLACFELGKIGIVPPESTKDIYVKSMTEIYQLIAQLSKPEGE